MQAFRSQPDHALHSLLVGLTFFHMACQKFVMKRHPLIVQVQYDVRFSKLLTFRSKVADISS